MNYKQTSSPRRISDKQAYIHSEQDYKNKKNKKTNNDKKRRKSKMFKDQDCDYDTLCLSYEHESNNFQDKYQNEKSILFY